MTPGLVGRLEAASAGDRNLDTLIANHFDTADTPHVTTSLDAALALAERVLPEWFWSIRKNVTTGHLVTVFALNEPPWTGSAYERMEQANAATPALALCIAVLKATTPTADEGGENV